MYTVHCIIQTALPLSLESVVLFASKNVLFVSGNETSPSPKLGSINNRKMGEIPWDILSL